MFRTAPWNRRALLGIGLGAVGLGTYWAVFAAGQDLVKDMLTRLGYPSGEIMIWSQFAYGFVQVTGSGIGLLAFGPISSRIGRRRAFIWFQLLAMAIVPITCFLPQTFWQLLVLLPLFGFLVSGMHAGFAIYFPELFPTHLRATGARLVFQRRTIFGNTSAAPFGLGEVASGNRFSVGDDSTQCFVLNRCCISFISTRDESARTTRVKP